MALLLCLALPGVAAANPATQIIVKRDPGLSAAERADIRADAQVRLVDTLPLARTELVAARPGDVQDALRDLEADPDVAYAQLNHRREALALPDDQGFPLQWGLHNVAQILFDDELESRGLYDADSDVVEAWDQGVTGAGVGVAVVDTGIVTHEDIDPFSIVDKRNFVFGESPTATADGDGHGTHVAGTIVAEADNGIGIAGAAPGAQVTVLRALDDLGRGTDADIAAAFDYAGDQGIKIVNASLGGDTPSPVIEDAIDDHPGTLFVVAAGNDGRSNGTTPTYPCDIAEPNIVCVGASTNHDERADFSNFGDESVDLFAPGEWILAPSIPGPQAYFFMAGTSMASPHVAAVAALVLDANPGLGAADLKALLLSSVDAKPAFEYSVTGGRLNAGVAVAEALGATTDTDGDGEIDAVDRCDADPQPGKPEGCPEPHSDGDGVADWYDNCDTTDNADQSDMDKDAVGNACDPDIDGDSFQNASDNCPTATNPTQRDHPDGDGVGDACDGDRDNDGVPNGSDLCPEEHAPGTSNGCIPRTSTPPPPADADGDGIADASDGCPNEAAATLNGCPLAQVASLSAKARKRSATVKVTTTRLARIRITVERKHGGRWVRVARETEAGRSATVRLSRLERGSHRVRVSVSSSAGAGTSVSKSFRVR
jgi:thermitase